MQEISPDYPFEPRSMEINGSKMSYIDIGKGDPIVFLHGNPTSSYLWRNIIPYLSDKARCIAPDLIGMGRSDKPDIDYTFLEHYDYLSKLLNNLELDNITLVIHDWGSALGFHYAHQHAKDIKGIAFMEAIYKAPRWAATSPKVKKSFQMLRGRITGWLMIGVANMFVKSVLPKTVVRALSEEEKKNYAAPYPTIKSRKPLRVWPRQIPFDGTPKEVNDIIENYHNWLRETDVPKLCFYSKPGMMIRKKDAEWIADNFPNTSTVDIGRGIHFVQEDNPHLIGREVSAWYDGL
ncbi:MAG: haloalkane dehalogenase [Bacteroidota bacterium]